MYHLFAGMWHPGECYYNTIMLQLFFIVEIVSCTFSALCMYSMFGHHPHPWATFVPNFISFVAYIAELAHGEKLRTQSINHSASLFDAQN